jgi:hypothetical protein
MPQTMDIVGIATHQVVRQKLDIHINSNFQNSQKLDPLQMAAKKYFRPKYASLSKLFWCKKLTHDALQK